MPKISNEPPNFNPDPEMWTLIQESPLQDGIYKTKIGNLSIFPYRNKVRRQWSDLLGVSVGNLFPFTATAIGAGTLTQLVDEANHPGIARFASAAGANTGHTLTLGGLTSVLVGGGEMNEFIFRFPTNSGVVVRLGFFDSLTSAAVTDGVQLVLSSGTIKGACTNNTTQSLTVTDYAIANNTWYRGKIEINDLATLVTFIVYDSNGTVLWTDTLATNIPTATGRECTFGVSAYKTTITGANLLDLDFLSYYGTKELVR